MITRKVDREDASPVGFAYRWVGKMGERLEKLYVITWQKSNRAGLSGNIEIVSLPKNKLLKIFALEWHLLRFLPKASGLFCHQNPEYVILSAPLAKVFGRKTVVWYAHGYAGWKLRLVNWLADKILTSSEKGCRLKKRQKIEVIGQGIDTHYFKKQKTAREIGDRLEIVSVGRISPAKDYQTLIEAMDILINEKGLKGVKAKVIGQPILKSDWGYYSQKLVPLIKENHLGDYIAIYPQGISHSQVREAYLAADLMVNLSQTGSLDKAVLEAMACQKLVLTCNEAFVDLLDDQRLIFQKKNHQDLADKISELMKLSFEERETIGQRLRDKVTKGHDLDVLIGRIIGQF